jgi:hypothetical protein
MTEKLMNVQLVVVRAFGAHQKGDVITDAATAASVLAGEQAHWVVRVAALAPQTTTRQGS